MKIRKATIDDIDSLLDLLSQILEVHAKIRPDLFVSGTTKYGRMDLLSMVDDDENPIFVAEMDNRVVGYAFCQTKCPTSNMTPNSIFHLDDLCVDENYRRQGIGRALFEFVKEEAHHRGCQAITLNSWPGNEAAARFYQSLGMKVRSIILECPVD